MRKVLLPAIVAVLLTVVPAAHWSFGPEADSVPLARPGEAEPKALAPPEPRVLVLEAASGPSWGALMPPASASASRILADSPVAPAPGDGTTEGEEQVPASTEPASDVGLKTEEEPFPGLAMEPEEEQRKGETLQVVDPVPLETLPAPSSEPGAQPETEVAVGMVQQIETPPAPQVLAENLLTGQETLEVWTAPEAGPAPPPSGEIPAQSDPVGDVPTSEALPPAGDVVLSSPTDGPFLPEAGEESRLAPPAREEAPVLEAVAVAPGAAAPVPAGDLAEERETSAPSLLAAAASAPVDACPAEPACRAEPEPKAAQEPTTLEKVNEVVQDAKEAVDPLLTTVSVLPDAPLDDALRLAKRASKPVALVATGTDVVTTWSKEGVDAAVCRGGVGTAEDLASTPCDLGEAAATGLILLAATSPILMAVPLPATLPRELGDACREPVERGSAHLEQACREVVDVCGAATRVVEEMARASCVREGSTAAMAGDGARAEEQTTACLARVEEAMPRFETGCRDLLNPAHVQPTQPQADGDSSPRPAPAAEDCLCSRDAPKTTPQAPPTPEDCLCTPSQAPGSAPVPTPEEIACQCSLAGAHPPAPQPSGSSSSDRGSSRAPKEETQRKEPVVVYNLAGDRVEMSQKVAQQSGYARADGSLTEEGLSKSTPPAKKKAETKTPAKAESKKAKASKSSR